MVSVEKLTLLEQTLLKAGLIDVADSFVEGKVLVFDLVKDEQLVCAMAFARQHGVRWQRCLLQFFLMLSSDVEGHVIRKAIGMEIEEVEPLIDLVIELVRRAAASEVCDGGLPN